MAHLLDNAVKYAKSDRPIGIKGWAEGLDILVSVSDHGVGIGADEQPKVFERFYRGASSMGVAGTGLGLSICKKFVKMHGGDIAVKGTEGEGATFTVRLPAQL